MGDEAAEAGRAREASGALGGVYEPRVLCFPLTEEGEELVAVVIANGGCDGGGEGGIT